MTGRRLLAPALGTALLLAAGCSEGERAAPDPAPAAPAPPAAERHEVALYFPGNDGRLHAEQRDFVPGPEPERAIAELVDELLAGPRRDGLFAPLPAAPDPPPPAEEDDQAVDDAAEAVPIGGVRVGLVHLLAGGIAVLDLETDARPAIGTRHERLSLYSLVNTILLNVPEADRLILLWNGEQPQTFAGHIDTAHPLTADRALIAEPQS